MKERGGTKLNIQQRSQENKQKIDSDIQNLDFRIPLNPHEIVSTSAKEVFKRSPVSNSTMYPLKSGVWAWMLRQ